MDLPRKGTWPGAALILSIFLLAGCGPDLRERVVIRTALGDIAVELYLSEAPVTAGNFRDLAEAGAYSGACFYRVVRMDNQPDNEVRIEVIQGGLYEEEQIGAFPAIIHETTEKTGIRHTDGVISMARMEPGTASTEFFICIGDQPSLDYGGARNPDGEGFAAFGKVVSGMETVRRIQSLPDSGQYLPEPLRIEQIEMVR